MEQWNEHTGLSAIYHFPLYKYRPQDKMKAAISSHFARFNKRIESLRVVIMLHN